MKKYLVGFMLALTAWAAPARADWLEAQSAHFVIDAYTSDARIRDFATRLERFDAALRMLYGVKDDPTRASNRVHVYATTSTNVVALCRGCPKEVAGFYHSRVGGSVIVTAALTSGNDDPLVLSAQAVLLHEYSHHFMNSNFPMAYPLWYSEGFAEFNANVRFKPDGAIVLGLPANYRAYGLRSDTGLTITQLLDPPPNFLKDPQRLELIYGRSWLLTHYLMLDATRRPMLDTYLSRMNKGATSLDAAKAAFGDLSTLAAGLSRYLSVNKLNAPFLIQPGKTAPAIAVAPLSPGAAAMMPLHMRSTVGVTPSEAKGLAVDAESRAAPYPSDPRVQVELAEADYDAEKDDAADAAASRALASDPKDVTALLYKGLVAVRRASKSKPADPAAWAAARKWYVAANHADPEAALPLLLFYQSYPAAEQTPPAIAVDGLAKAQTLAPEDGGVRWLLAREKLDGGDTAWARALLQPIAFAPHRGSQSDAAKGVIDAIDAGRLDDARKAMRTPPKDDDEKADAHA